LFLDFLVSIFAEENFQFLCAVGAYKKIPNLNVRKQRAALLFAKYVKRDAPFQINIKSDTIDTIQRDVGLGAPELFETAQQEIKRILENYCLPEFLTRMRVGHPSQLEVTDKRIQRQRPCDQLGILIAGFHTMTIAPFVDLPISSQCLHL